MGWDSIALSEYELFAADLAVADAATCVALCIDEPVRTDSRWGVVVTGLVRQRLTELGVDLPAWVVETTAEPSNT
ncbi:hypothetical protein [Microbacterium sp. A84]|uniref:hypothetical protein n=1 Tax=Microbacterium sp. A84 TaxID=3450715 RepID=UPI003F42768B